MLTIDFTSEAINRKRHKGINVKLHGLLLMILF